MAEVGSDNAGNMFRVLGKVLNFRCLHVAMHWPVCRLSVRLRFVVKRPRALILSSPIWILLGFFRLRSHLYVCEFRRLRERPASDQRLHIVGDLNCLGFRLLFFFCRLLDGRNETDSCTRISYFNMCPPRASTGLVSSSKKSCITTCELYRIRQGFGQEDPTSALFVSLPSPSANQLHGACHLAKASPIGAPAVVLVSSH